MHVQRLLPVLLSVLLALGIWIYGVLSLRTDGGAPGVGYAALVCGDSYSDLEIRGRLDGRGLSGLVSESDQWVLLDCFGGVEKIPLVEYPQRLLPFDPRNDGYAEKLRSLFVRDGKRFVYIPLGTNSLERMETEIAQALNGISYSLEYNKPPPKRDFLLPLTAFSLTACAFFVIPALRRRLNAGLLPCLPALSPLALGLAPGFSLVSLLAGFAALLAQPGRKAAFSSGLQSGPLMRDLPELFTAKWFLAAALIACYGFFSFFSGLPVLLAFFVLAAFCCLLPSAIRSGGGAMAGGAMNGGASSGGKIFRKITVKKMPARSRRFIPVEIISRRSNENYSFFPVMLPFAVMALALAFAGYARQQPPSLPVMNISPLPFTAQPAMAPPPGAVTEADFQEHFLFQSSFSLRALGKINEGGGRPVIAAYGLSSSGLLEPQPSPQPSAQERRKGSPLEPAPAIADGELRIPDFPLGDLLRGLNSSPPPAPDTEDRGNSPAVNLLFALLPMAFILPSFIYGIKKKRRGKTASRNAI